MYQQRKPTAALRPWVETLWHSRRTTVPFERLGLLERLRNAADRLVCLEQELLAWRRVKFLKRRLLFD